MLEDKYIYKVTWSKEDEAFVGLCAEFPSLSWISESEDEASKGIHKLVRDDVKDLKKHNEPVPKPQV